MFSIHKFCPEWKDFAFTDSYSATLEIIEAACRLVSKSQTAAHAALIAGFAFFDGAVLGRGEFQQVAKLGGLICQKAGCLGDVEFLLAGVGFVTGARPGAK